MRSHRSEHQGSRIGRNDRSSAAERIASRTRRRRYDKPVCPVSPQQTSVHMGLDPDHRRGILPADHHLVYRHLRFGQSRAFHLQEHLPLEIHPPAEKHLHRLASTLLGHCRHKTECSQVDPHDGYIGPVSQLRRPQDRPVAAQSHHIIRIGGQPFAVHPRSPGHFHLQGTHVLQSILMKIQLGSVHGQSLQHILQPTFVVFFYVGSVNGDFHSRTV